jgi:hypothetical protein
MQLKDKVVVIYGAGGAIGGAVARTFAREGAKVFLSGRTLSKVECGAGEIVAAGGTAEAFQVDAVQSQVADASGRSQIYLRHADSRPCTAEHRLAWSGAAGFSRCVFRTSSATPRASRCHEQSVNQWRLLSALKGRASALRAPSSCLRPVVRLDSQANPGRLPVADLVRGVAVRQIARTCPADAPLRRPEHFLPTPMSLKGVQGLHEQLRWPNRPSASNARWKKDSSCSSKTRQR